MHEDGRRRVVITGVEPEIEAGRFPIKRTEGERVCVQADIFTDGHDAVSCRVLYRREDDAVWSAVTMNFLANDRWQAEFTVETLYFTARGFPRSCGDRGLPQTCRRTHAPRAARTPKRPLDSRRTAATSRLEAAASWTSWVSAAFLKAYLDIAGCAAFVPSTREQVETLLTAYLLEKATYEIMYELNNRPAWTGIPIRGMLQLIR